MRIFMRRNSKLGRTELRKNQVLAIFAGKEESIRRRARPECRVFLRGVEPDNANASVRDEVGILCYVGADEEASQPL